jgi:hypothetical protein
VQSQDQLQPLPDRLLQPQLPQPLMLMLLLAGLMRLVIGWGEVEV